MICDVFVMGGNRMPAAMMADLHAARLFFDVAGPRLRSTGIRSWREFVVVVELKSSPLPSYIKIYM
jgi:hypothetical protein